MKLDVSGAVTAVVSTVAASLLLMTFSTVREVQTDVQVTMALLTEHKEQHTADAAIEQEQARRLTAVERLTALNNQLIGIYHGVPTVNGE